MKTFKIADRVMVRWSQPSRGPATSLGTVIGIEPGNSTYRVKIDDFPGGYWPFGEGAMELSVLDELAKVIE